MNGADEHKTSDSTFLPTQRHLHVWFITRINEIFSCKISNGRWIHDLDGKLGVAVIPKDFIAEESVPLFSSGGLTLSLLCVCRVLALQRVTALSSTHQPTSRTWEKVSEGRDCRADCCDVFWVQQPSKSCLNQYELVILWWLQDRGLSAWRLVLPQPLGPQRIQNPAWSCQKGCRTCWCHLQQGSYFCIFLEWSFCSIPASEKLLEKQRKRKRQRHTSAAVHSKKEKNEEGLGETPHSEVLLGLHALIPITYWLFPRVLTWQSLSQRHLLACHLRICPTDAAAWAGLRLKIPPWSSNYFVMMLNSDSVFKLFLS